jgi:hypothetical protein
VFLSFVRTYSDFNVRFLPSSIYVLDHPDTYQDIISFGKSPFGHEVIVIIQACQSIGHDLAVQFAHQSMQLVLSQLDHNLLHSARYVLDAGTTHFVVESR